TIRQCILTWVWILPPVARPWLDPSAKELSHCSTDIDHEDTDAISVRIPPGHPQAALLGYQLASRQSIIVPASRALYTLKSTVGVISTAGIVPITNFSNAVGPMTRSARGLAILINILVNPLKTTIPEGVYGSAANGSWKGPDLLISTQARLDIMSLLA
ncbi:hypothetical protein AOQ84DRAFT_365444, partial [Glonium stellatum]